MPPAQTTVPFAILAEMARYVVRHPSLHLGDSFHFFFLLPEEEEEVKQRANGLTRESLS